MVRLVYKVALIDLLLLVALYFVFGDLAWRAYYAGTAHAGLVRGYGSAFSYSLLTRTFTMTGGAIPLVSPPTLDWVQVLVYLLVVLNGWFAYSTMISGRLRKIEAPQNASAP